MLLLQDKVLSQIGTIEMIDLTGEMGQGQNFLPSMSFKGLRLSL